MKSVTVPLFSFEATLADAMSALTAEKRSGVVVDDHQQLWIIMADALDRANTSGKKHLVEIDIQSRIPAGRPDADRDLNDIKKLFETSDSSARVDTDEMLSLGLSSYEYAAVPFSRNDAFVIARVDADADSLEKPPPPWT